MRSTLLIALGALALTLAAAGGTDYVNLFESFKARYGKKYSTKKEEFKRFRIFVENMKLADAHNAANPLAKFGANEFADLSAAEFKNHHNAEKVYSKLVAETKNKKLRGATAEELRLASEGRTIDWRTRGAVTAVKNQADCGSCWSFSTTGSVEGQWFLAGNPLVSLSEQLFVSCDTLDDGCQGGLMDTAFKWAVEDNNGQLVTEASYPYVSGDGIVPACNRQGNIVGATISGHLNVEHNETAMGAWTFANGPLSVAVDATSWQLYFGGIMTNCISQSLDHGVLIVGFDDTNSPPYWIVKNSWGASWGESGYIRLEKGTNQCLINNYPCSSIVGPTQAPTPMPPTPPPTPMPPTPPPTIAPPSPPIKYQWVDLFQPPYTQVPTVSMAISCITSTDCFLPGGASGVGFDVFNFNGRRDGTFTPLTMTDPCLMMMAISMGGTESKPQGVAGGFGIGNGLQFAWNATYFAPSLVPTLLVETQDIRTSADGYSVIAIDSHHVLYSWDAGITFSEYLINSNPPSCAFGRYGAMVSGTEWFVTMGSWSNSNSRSEKTKGVKSVHELSERVSMVRDSKGRVQRVTKSMRKQIQEAQLGSGSSSSGSCGYTAVIAHTSDGGQTFTNLFVSEGENATFYFNAIDCASSTNCVAVAEGFNADAAARIFHTTDGKTFKEVFKLVSNSTTAFSLMSVRFRNANEVWAAGSAEGQFTSTGVFLVSTDGGATWTDASSTLSNIGDVTAISFTADGLHGFATAVTVYDDSTILRYGAKLPPAPPSPPTSGPTGSFTQEQCQDTQCSVGCQNISFNTGVCLPLTGGGSAIVTCTPTTLNEVVYQTNDCTGSSQSASVPLDTCEQMTGGGSFENYCSSNPTPPSPPSPPSPPAPPTAAPTQAPTGTLTQMDCTDSACSQGCQNFTFGVGVCLNVTGGGSAIVTCTATTLNEVVYQSDDCTGASQSGSVPLNTCQQTMQGGYVENFCTLGVSEPGAPYTAKAKLVRRQPTLWRSKRPHSM